MPHCNLKNFLLSDKKYSNIYELLESTCAARFIIPGRFRPGITLLIPSKDYLEKVEKLIKGNKANVEEAGYMMRAIILPDVYHTVAEFEANKENILNVEKTKLDIEKASGSKVELKNGAVLEKNKDFEEASTTKDKEGKLVYKLAVWNITKGAPQIKGSAGKKSKKKPVVKKTGGTQNNKVERLQDVLVELLLKMNNEQLKEFIHKYDAHLLVARKYDLWFALSSLDEENVFICAMIRATLRGASELAGAVSEFFEEYLIKQISIEGELKEASGDVKLADKPKSLFYDGKLAEKLDELREDYIASSISEVNFISKLKEITNKFFDTVVYTKLLDEWMKAEFHQSANNFLVLSRLCHYMQMAEKGIAKYGGQTVDLNAAKQAVLNFVCGMNKQAVMIFCDLAGDMKEGGFMVVEPEIEVEGAYDFINSTSLGIMKGAAEANTQAGFDVISYQDYKNGADGIIDFNM